MFERPSSGITSAMQGDHVIRTVPPYNIYQELIRFDAGLRHSFERLSISSISDQVQQQATLPIQHGGVGLRETSRTSSAAFVGSCKSLRQLSN